MKKKIIIVLFIISIFINTLFIYNAKLTHTKYDFAMKQIDRLFQYNFELSRKVAITDGIKNIEKKITNLKPNISQLILTDLSCSIYTYSLLHPTANVDLIIAIAFVESSFRKYAKSSADCLGYWQINPKVHNVDLNQIYDGNYNLSWAMNIYNYNMKLFKGNQTLALNAYNGWASKKNPYANKVFKYIKKIEKV
jgi:hypothetical protein